MFFVENDQDPVPGDSTRSSENTPLRACGQSAFPGSADDLPGYGCLRRRREFLYSCFSTHVVLLLPFSTSCSGLLGNKTACLCDLKLKCSMNFSADFTRRTAGQLAAGRTEEPGDPCEWMLTCGGPWWRDVAMEACPLRSKPETSSPQQKPWWAVTRSVWHWAGSMLQVTVPGASLTSTTSLSTTWYFLRAASTGYGYLLMPWGTARKVWLRAIGKLDDDD